MFDKFEIVNYLEELESRELHTKESSQVGPLGCHGEVWHLRPNI